MILKFVIALLFVLSFTIGRSQSVLKDSILSAFLIEIHYGIYLPAADLEDRFGAASFLGPGLKFKTKRNYIFGLESQFIFGGNVKEDDILDNILTQSGNLINIEGTLEDFTLAERGFFGKFEFGKIISFKKPNINSGLFISTGVGVLQHKIRIDVDKGLVPQLNKNMQKGYDRLTRGLAISQFVGYRYFSERRLINLFAGFEVIEGFTKSRRAFNFDDFTKDTQNRMDIALGFRFGFVIPIYFQQTEKYYYY